jgi:hypothetical protein
VTLDVIPRTDSAGGSAEQRYDGMLKSWGARPIMRRIRLVALGLGVLFMVAGAKTGDALAFNLGVLAGASVTFWCAVRDTVLLCEQTHHDLHSGGRRIRLKDGRVLDQHGWVDNP